MLKTRVLVIGGGPAGSAAARFLAGRGIETILIDRDFSFVKPCGGGVPSSVFEELEIPSNQIKRHIDTIKIISPRMEALPIKLTGGFLAIVQRDEFDSYLRKAAEQAGARLLEAEFRSFAGIGRTIVSEAVENGRNIRIHSDYVIAADGVNSRARTALNIAPVPSLVTLSEKIYGERADSCEFWFGSAHAPRFYSWVFPQGSGVSAGTGALNGKELKTLWQIFAGKRGLKEEGRLRGYKIPIWQGDFYNIGRILFAGDSAGHVMPLSYEGIYYAMKSGELAAAAIAEGKPAAYKKLWEKRFYRRFLLMRRMWEYFLKNDHNAEQLVRMHRRPEVQEASMRLWLRKDSKSNSLLTYIRIFKGFLG